MKIRKNNKGFTLVELLLVMAIIGILAGVIFVTTAPARKKARITTFKQHMKDLATAGSMCVDNDGTISAGVPNGASTFCTNSDDTTNTYPKIKICKGGSAPILTTTVTNGTNDDFVITASCVVTGTGASAIECYAECTVNGCKFGNTAVNGAVTVVDGCPAT